MVPSGPVTDAIWTTEAEDPDWDDAVRAAPFGHFLQTASWGRVRAGQGWSVLRLAARSGGSALPVAQVLVRTTPLGALAYVPRGPVCGPGDARWPWALARLRERLAPTCLAARIEPNWPDGAEAGDAIARAGLVRVAPVQPRSTVRVDLTDDESRILGRMKQKWRYNVRLAERRGIRVRLGDERDLATFERLMDVTAERDAFPRRASGYYTDVWRHLGDAARLYVAAVEGADVAAILVVHCGATATYLYGASSDRERQRMPNHALQWAAMRDARRSGCAWYDLWGVPDEVGRAVAGGGQPEDAEVGEGGLWGVWGFKRGFGGEVWRSAGAADAVYRPLRYRIAASGLAVLRGLSSRVGR